MWHYKIFNSLNKDEEIALDSSRREGFKGYESSDQAYIMGLASKIENRLSDLYVIKTYKVK